MSTYVDTLDVLDLDFVESGENSVIGEGTTIVGHTFRDGKIVFSQARVLFWQFLQSGLDDA